ncbi:MULTISPECIES: MFS transporter [unclassified Pseudomonas]|uniref:MFS transporter n=1 Tax=unclassified Pseudomonas TaxID=196821 RepID=UPI000DAA8015|nr:MULTISPECIES: MFS transporter [unclassified Pseudomonas]MDW3714312.1 MFS transporter [Pseudomonas sp. 2023EL-01195]PZE13829.1 MFS transporter [Pseudomonas sp. 57B-090624]
MPSRGSLSPAQAWLLAVACGLSVANVYYAHPLLDAMASDLGISRAAIGGVISVTQAGSALALLVLVPLGDLLERRQLMAAQLLLLVGSLLLVALARQPWLTLLGMLGLGLLGTAMTQGLLAFAASLAGDAQRGRVLGLVQGGVVVGLLLARSLSGAMADLGGWRAVYLLSALLMAALLPVLWRCLPALRSEAGLGYPALLRSMFVLLREDRVLQVRGVLALLLFTVFNLFWAALVMPLSAPPLSLSPGAIGAFGLVGVVGALAAARAGRWADRGQAQRASGLALALLALAWVPLAFTGQSLWALVLGILLLDAAGQALHVLNQSLVLGGGNPAHARLISLYMLFYAAGSALGAFAATHLHARAGWLGVCLAGGALSLLALAFWWATLPGRNGIRHHVLGRQSGIR